MSVDFAPEPLPSLHHLYVNDRKARPLLDGISIRVQTRAYSHLFADCILHDTEIMTCPYTA